MPVWSASSTFHRIPAMPISVFNDTGAGAQQRWNAVSPVVGLRRMSR
ncbi:hypothetical protein [Streptomyces sp. NPDC058964]